MDIEEKQIDIGNIGVFYRAAGAGKPVLVLHGWPTSSYLWRNIIPKLAENRRVIAPDLPGYGRSAKPADIRYDLGFYVEWLDALIAAEVTAKKLDLVVHDFGGPVGLTWAVRHPDRINRLVILDTMLYPDLPWRQQLMLRSLLLPGVRALLYWRRGFAFGMRRGAANRDVMSREVINAYHEPYRSREGRRALIKTLADFDLADLKEQADGFKDLKAPALIIWARNDPILPVANAERLAAELPDARLKILDDCGHFLQEEKPATVASVINDFL